MKTRWHIAQATESLWWRWYLHRRNPADYLQWKTEYWRHFFERFELDLQPQGALLEVGCGPAGVGLVLPCERLTLLDPLLKRYQELFPAITQRSLAGCRLVYQPLESWETHEKFEHIYCFNVINHCQDLERCAHKLTYLLQDGGSLYLSTDCHRHESLKLLFRRIPADVLHPQQYDLGDYVALFEGKGLELQATHCVHRGRIFEYQLLIFKK